MKWAFLAILVVSCYGQTTFTNTQPGTTTFTTKQPGTLTMNTVQSGGGGGGSGIGSNAYCGAGDSVTLSWADAPAGGQARCFFTALSATPSPGAVTPIANAGALTTALATGNAICGTTLQLPANTALSGVFTITSVCDSAHYLTIETSAVGSIPLEQHQINPSYAGVISLPGRPAFTGGTSNVMAQVITNNVNQPVFTIASGASYIRFIGLEMTRVTGGGQVVAIVAFAGSNTHVIFDRCWIHGTSVDETRRAFDMNQTNYIALIDSYLTDFHCLSPGTCIDSQGVSGGGGNPLATDGAWKIVDNFIEAAAEGMELGGGNAAFIPADLEIRANHFFKPFIWNPAHPSYNGGVSGHSWLVKNAWEAKNAENVLLEGNIFDNVWEGFGQNGNAITLTPKNPTPNLCAVCAVQDVVVRYNIIRNATQWMLIDNGISGTSWAVAGQRYAIHDNWADGIMYQYRNGTTLNDLQLSSSYFTATPPPSTLTMNNVLLNHNTVIEQGGASFSGMLNIRGPVAGNPTAVPQMFNINYTNNLQATGVSVFNSTGGGADNCIVGHLLQPVNILSFCWVTSSITGNTFIQQYTGSKTWPSGNLFPATWPAVGFVNYSQGIGGDYRLCNGVGSPSPACAAASIYAATGTDGKDPGANIPTVNTFTGFQTNPAIEILVPNGATNDINYTNNLSAMQTDWNVAGATITIYLSDFDCGTPTCTTGGSAHDHYDFATIDDAAISSWATSGKKVNFVVQIVSNGPANTCSASGVGSRGVGSIGNCAMPGWMWTMLGASNYSLCGSNGTQRIPNYFNSAWVTAVRNAWAAVITHYASNPAVGYMRISPGKGGEMLPDGTWNSSCLSQLETWSSTGSMSAFIGAWETYLSNWANYLGSLNSPIQLMGAITPMGTSSGCTGCQVPDFIVPIYITNHMGYGSQGLEFTDIGNNANSTADWVALFNSNAGKVPQELQTLGQSCPVLAACDTGNFSCGAFTNQSLAGCTGPLGPLWVWGSHNKATILEIYYQDWLLGNVSSYCTKPGLTTQYCYAAWGLANYTAEANVLTGNY